MQLQVNYGTRTPEVIQGPLSLSVRSESKGAIYGGEVNIGFIGAARDFPHKVGPVERVRLELVEALSIRCMVLRDVYDALRVKMARNTI